VINYPCGWFDVEQLPGGSGQKEEDERFKEEVEDVFIADGSINGLTNYSVFTVPVSLDIKEKYGVIHTAQRMREDGWTYYERS
tara:strand:+ start:1509 stop:1757 length:249 start_codon:yes stop_codon:yes gene_type:complete